ncbi:tail fiber assembly protein [Rhizobium puerariae]|uniref:Tail fiber assembly protein n=1 Tax=Rhizobium puerariae TaxID=1585791 RepID=A0ABV6AN31_9HYPH
MGTYRTPSGSAVVEASQIPGDDKSRTVACFGGKRNANPTDWIVMGKFGDTSVMTDDVFRATYISIDADVPDMQSNDRRDVAILAEDGTVSEVIIGVLRSVIPNDGDYLHQPFSENGAIGKVISVDRHSGVEPGKALPWPRAWRDQLLDDSDWTEVPSIQASHSDEWKQNWADYRKALRDLPEQNPDPSAINWPAAPDR